MGTANLLNSGYYYPFCFERRTYLIRSPSYYKLANILRLITQLEFYHVTCILGGSDNPRLCILWPGRSPSSQSRSLSYWLLSIISCQILAKSHRKSWWSHNWLFGSHLPTPETRRSYYAHFNPSMVLVYSFQLWPLARE